MAEDAATEPQVWLFGYGSLISKGSRSRTCPECEGGRSFPGTVKGMTRGWFHHVKLPESMVVNEQILGVSAVAVITDPNPSAQCFGIIFAIAKSSLKGFDDREVGYQRMAIDWESVLPSDAAGQEEMRKAQAAQEPLYCFTLEKKNEPTVERPVIQSYVDVILDGCSEVSDDCVREFIRTTEGWPESIGGGEYVQDRAAPGYVRWSAHAAARSSFWDAALEAEVPGLLSRRKLLVAPKEETITPVDVRIDEPWLDLIVSGKKKYEGRVWRGPWKKLLPGHRLNAQSENYKSVLLDVEEVLHFKDFDLAFELLGPALLPEGAATPAEALRIYRQWNSEESVKLAGGVVAVKVRVLDFQRVDGSDREPEAKRARTS